MWYQPKQGAMPITEQSKMAANTIAAKFVAENRARFATFLIEASPQVEKLHNDGRLEEAAELLHQIEAIERLLRK